MSKHIVYVKQIYTTTRVIAMEVEADDAESAREEVDSGNVDLPDHDDPNWETSWVLRGETSQLEPFEEEDERLRMTR